MIEWQKLEMFDFIAKCSDGEKKKLSSLFSTVFLRRFDPIYHEDDPTKAVYLIEKGMVEMSRTSDDGQKVYSLGLLKKGDIFGFGEMFFDTHYITTMSRSNTVLFKMKKEDFFETLLTIPLLNRYVMDAMASIIRQKTLMIDWEKADNRLFYLLSFLSSRYGTIKNGRIIIDYKLTQEKLAAALDISREHFNRLYLKLKKDKIIGRTGKKLLYIDEVWLKEKNIDEKLARIFKRKFTDEIG